LILKSIGPIIFFVEHKAGGGWLPLIPVGEWSPRSILKLAGPIDLENDRTDHHVSSEVPVEDQVKVLEQKRSPRPVLKLIGPTGFFAEREVRGRGRPIFLKVGWVGSICLKIAGSRTGFFLKILCG